MDPNARLRIATRIHFALLRHLGDSVDVQDILHRPSQTREVLWVCDASGDDELIALAAQFRHASRSETPAATVQADRPPAPPTDSAFDREGSGFGVSRPPEPTAAKPSPPRDWLKPSTWLKTR